MARFNRIFQCILVITLFATPTLHAQTSGTDRRWFIVLPLRFTQLQNNNTMLSGVKVGRALNERLDVSASIYHSFYVKSFKAPANLNGFEEQPRLFINCMGGEIEYRFYEYKKISLGLQLLLGWGFVKYDLNAHTFSTKQVNYLATEPTINIQWRINPNTHLGVGFGYRPILSGKQIAYTSDVSNGNIPVAKQFPNGLMVAVTLRGLL